MPGTPPLLEPLRAARDRDRVDATNRNERAHRARDGAHDEQQQRAERLRSCEHSCNDRRTVDRERAGPPSCRRCSRSRASRLFDLLNMVRPLPPPFVTLQQLVASDAATVSIDSLLRLTNKGSEALDAAIAAGVWQCRINAVTKDTSS